MPRAQLTDDSRQPIRGTAQKIEKWASEGWTKRGIARGLGVSPERLNKWMEEHPRLRDAWYAGREAEHQKLYGKMMEQVEAGNMTAVIFALKTRHDYREHAPIADANATPAVTINLPAPMTAEQFRSLSQPRAGRVIDHGAD